MVLSSLVIVYQPPSDLEGVACQHTMPQLAGCVLTTTKGVRIRIFQGFREQEVLRNRADLLVADIYRTTSNGNLCTRTQVTLQPTDRKSISSLRLEARLNSFHTRISLIHFFRSNHEQSKVFVTRVGMLDKEWN